MIFIPAASAGLLAFVLLLAPSLPLHMPHGLVLAALAFGLAAACGTAAILTHLARPPISVLSSKPEAFRKALGLALNPIATHWHGHPDFEASWYWNSDGLTEFRRISAASDAQSAHARLADETALANALVHATALLGPAMEAAGGDLVLSILWQSKRVCNGQTRPDLLTIYVGPKVLPWANPHWGGYANIRIATWNPCS